ncbi:MAG: hypothetical protein QM710_15355 [Flavobacterium sp.]
MRTEKLASFLIEVSGFPKTNSVNSKYFNEKDYAVLEIYGEKNIRLRIEYRATGNIVYNYSDGKVKHEIPFSNKKANGVYKKFASDGSLLLEVPFKNNLRNGLSKYYIDDKTVECEFANDKITGKIKVTDKQRNTTAFYPSNFEKGEIEYYRNGNLSAIVPFTDRGILNGKVIFYDYGGFKKIEYNHTNGVLDGKTEYFDGSGNLIQSSMFKNGVPIGSHKIFWSGGTLYAEKYYDDSGIKTGTWKTYKSNGKLEKVTPYQNGKINGIENTYLDGQLLNSREYVDDKINGLSIIYKNNRKESEIIYKNSKQLGWTYYFSSGKVAKKVKYDSNTIPLSITCYNVDGNVIYDFTYKENAVNITKEYIYKSDDTYFIATETEYDPSKFITREKMFFGNNDYSETFFSTNGSKMTTKKTGDAFTKKYYIQTKEVTEADFNKFQQQK